MRKTGQLMMRNLGLVVLLLTAWTGSAFAAGAATPELAEKAARVRNQMEQRVSNAERQAAADSLKALREQIHSYQQMRNDPTQRIKGGTSVGTSGIPGVDFDTIPTGPNQLLISGLPKPPDYNTTANWAFTPPVAKFVDTLSPLGCSSTNNLGQCIPVAVPDILSYPGSDYYEIKLIQWSEQMHSDLGNGTPVRGYVQVNNGTDVSGGAPDLSLCGDAGQPTCLTMYGALNTVAPPRDGGGDPIGHYMGPIIIAERDRPVRIKFTNELPTGTGGDLFIPVDESVMGAGAGPSEPTATRGTVVECNNDDIENNNCAHYTQNRATIHLHGGRTPWISDGTPHQWITPATENTPYPQGVSVANVPDMPDPGDGSMTFYYSNQQTARLLFYHDHAFGITRLNVLAGMAAGYLIQDKYERDLMARNVIPAEEIPLVIQDRTFVDATPMPNPFNNNVLTPTVRVYDPLWNYGTGPVDANGVRQPVTGDLWLPHVYMPAQNPWNPDNSGVNPFGRWMYGPWFYPPTLVNHPPVANPYYDPDCSSTNPYILADCQTPGQPPLIPATPEPSMGMEAFFDSMIVNGTLFPRLNVDPKAYRFRILNAGNDRALNLSIYKADGTPANLSPVLPGSTTPFSGAAVPANFDRKTEVKMVPAQANAGWPELWPIDGRPEGVPDPGTFDPASGRWSNWGPSFIQIGNDAGFLPAPAIRDPQPITYVTDPTAFWVGIVKDTALALMPAERADVVVDFSQYAGETLIVYNDAPAAWPAGVSNYDYWTGAPDYRDSGGYGAGGTFNAVTGVFDGGHGPLPGLAPNTRTVMQIVVSGTKGVNGTPFDMAALEDEFTVAADPTAVDPDDGVTLLNPDGRPLFERAMEPIIVAQSAYDAAYGKTFPAVAPWGGVRYSIDDNHIFKFETIAGEQVSVLMKPKGIHDEMGASFDAEYGRMSGNLAIELQPPKTNNANLNLYAFSDVPTEIIDNSETADVQVDVLGQLQDGTQIWNISHNGVDTHPIHFHIFDVQPISRLGWDNQIMTPLPNELGWKDTLRISPLMDTVVAVRPVAPAMPFGVPNSIRPLNPALRLGSTMGFSNVDPVTGQAYAPPSFWGLPDNNFDPAITGVHNVLYDFGWEYVWHCHILSHEEMDMMRPIILQVATLQADAFALTQNAGDLSWGDPTPVDYQNYPNYVTGSKGSFGNAKNEIGFNVWRSALGTGPWTKVGSTLANHLSYNDGDYQAGDSYVIEAYNAGNTTYSSALSTVTLHVAPGTSFATAPQNLTLTTTIGAPLSANTIDRVEYYNGTTLIGSATGPGPYTFNWDAVQGGNYSLTALVVALGPDLGTPVTNSELYAVSAPVAVTLGGGMTIDPFTTAPLAPTVCDAITLTSGAITGGNGTYTYSWQINGVTLAGDGALAGPLPAGVYPTILTVTDSAGLTATISQDVTVVASPPIATAGGPYNVDFGGTVTLAGSGSPSGTCGGAVSLAWNIDPAAGATYDYFSNRTLKYSVLAGWLGVGSHTIRLKVTDALGQTATSDATLTVGAAPYAISTTALANGTVGTAYSQTLAVTGAAGATTWAVYGLPAGLTLDPNTGIISGTPTAANIRPGSTKATIPVSIINIDATAPGYTTSVLFITITL